MKYLLMSLLLTLMGTSVTIARGIPGYEKIPLDDPSKYNWTNPDLFRWVIYGNDLKDRFIDDRPGYAFYNCSTTMTERTTWHAGKMRYFKESRYIICGSGNFRAMIEGSCTIGVSGAHRRYTPSHAGNMYIRINKKFYYIGITCR